MATVTAPLLKRQRIFHSRDAAETRAFLRNKEFRFDGFTHMGRFSVEYRQRFAETLSSTLAQSRRGSASHP